MNLPDANTIEQPPAGTHAAICCAFIDLGTQADEWQGDRKLRHQVIIRWELSDEPNAEGRPFTIGQFYTWSMADKAKLRLHLESWRGRPFEKADLGANGRFSTRKLLGVPCTLTVGLSENGKARVVAVGPKMKGVQPHPLVSPTTYLALTEADFDPAILEGLSDRLRAKIKASPEYRRIVNADTTDAGPNQVPFDDEIPF
jgi:hypothetical protein